MTNCEQHLYMVTTTNHITCILPEHWFTVQYYRPMFAKFAFFPDREGSKSGEQLTGQAFWNLGTIPQRNNGDQAQASAYYEKGQGRQ